MQQDQTITPPKGYTLDQPQTVTPPPGYQLDAPGHSAPMQPDFTSNPNREGVYQMQGGNGQTIGVPFSRVPDAQKAHYTLTAGDESRYRGDYAATQPKPPGPLDRLAQWGEKTFASIPQGTPAVISGPGVQVSGEPARLLENGVNRFARNMTAIPATVVDKVKALATPDAWTPAGYQKQQNAQMQQAQQNGTLRIIEPGEMPKPTVADWSDYGADKLGDLATTYVIGKGIEALPGIASRVGPLSRDSGANRMDRFLNGGKPLELDSSGNPVYDSHPGYRVLEAGPSTSIATSRANMIPKVNAARQAPGREIGHVAMASPSAVGTAPLWDSVNRVVDPMIQDATGPLGNQNLADRLEDMRQSFLPELGGKNYLPIPDALQLKRTMDRNINRMGGFVDDTSNAANSAAQQIRAGIKNNIYDAEPALREPSEQYEGLSDALDMMKANQKVRDARFFTRAVRSLMR